jgi:hypothetical protein
MAIDPSDRARLVKGAVDRRKDAIVQHTGKDE